MASRQESVGLPNDVATLQRELQEERNRLQKLWAAYRSQEDELNRLQSSGLLERQVGDQAKRIATMEREEQALRRQLDQVQSDLDRAKETLRSYESENEDLRGKAAYEKKAIRLEEALAQERERLAKLYKVHQDTEAEKREADILLLAWQEWYKALRPSLRRSADAIARAPGQAD